MALAPIVLFVYNRPWHTRQTIEALQKNFLADESDLYIYSDGWKSERDKNSVLEVRDYLKTVNGFKNVQIIEKDKNFGLANSVISGVTEIVNKFGKIIVMEDDLVSSPNFLKFMNDALSFYQDKNEVASVHGYLYPVKEVLPETFFLNVIDSWGWGTWKRAWSLFESDGKKLMNEILAKKLAKKFDLDNSYHFTNMLAEQIKGLNNSWAIRWYASTFLAGKLSLYPRRSLIKNIGNDDSGTHTGSIHVFDVEVDQNPIEIKNIPIEESVAALKAFQNYFKSPKNYLFFKALRVKSWLRIKLKSA